MGMSQGHSYESESGRVTWIFERIERVYAIGEPRLQSGMGVFSRFLRDSEVQSLLTPFGGEWA
jgi:hypothetical protein